VPAPRRAGYAPWNDRAVGEAGTGIPSRAFSLRSLEALIDSLQGVIERLRWRCADSAWSDYYTSMHNYGAAGLAAKEECVAAYLDLAAPRTVWDLGANDGRFSRLASRRGAFTVAWDLDPVCVERNFLQAQSTGEKNLLPLLIDLTNPSPALGWAHAERQSLVERGPAELVLALGLIHHLAIGNNVPLERLASFLAALGRKLIIEFVPREDAQVQRMLSSREDIFGAYDRAGFESAFGRHFRIECSHPLPGVRRLYLMTRR
jgi:ribosomal protein L11 methylase PrmA